MAVLVVAQQRCLRLPVAISISVATYSCHQSSSITIASSISSTCSTQFWDSTYSTYNSHQFFARTISASNIHGHVTSTTTPTVSNEPASMIYNIGLISGVVVASVIIIICISTITITTIIAIAIAKRHRKFNIATSSNEAYGELIKLDNVMQNNIQYSSAAINTNISE